MKLKALLRHQMLPLGLAFALILVEAFLTLLFPLFIGRALDGAMHGVYLGVLQLGLLGFATVIIGLCRRFFDSRLYSKIYQKIGPKLVQSLDGQDTSIKSARLGMLKELVEFLEFSLPELIHAIISLFGVILIIAQLDLNIFLGALLCTALILMIYWISSSKTLSFNKAANDEQEKQVAVVSKKDEPELKNHLRKMMKWNIKLSDLEAVNFSLAWFILMIFLVASIIISVQNPLVKYGALLSLIIYVFQYMESVINLPFFYQSWLRLKEITHRLFLG